MVNLSNKSNKKILTYFFTNPKTRAYLRELAKDLDIDPGNLSKSLKRLVKEGLIIAEKVGTLKYFSLNQKYPLYKELKEIIFKTEGVEGAIKKALEDVPKIESAFIYGSFAKGEEDELSDIDLLIIGDVSFEELDKRIAPLEKKLNREINYTFFTLREYQKRIKRKDPFLIDLIKGKKIVLIGSLDEKTKKAAH